MALVRALFARLAANLRLCIQRRQCMLELGEDMDI